MFGKIIDGSFTEAPRNLGNILNFDKDETLMREHGYKPVIEGERPATREGYYIVVRYVDGDESIQQVYDEFELPPEIDTPEDDPALYE